MKKAKPTKKAAEAGAASTTTASGLDLGAIRELALIAEEFGLMEIEADRPATSASRAAAPTSSSAWAPARRWAARPLWRRPSRWRPPRCPRRRLPPAWW